MKGAEKANLLEKFKKNDIVKFIVSRLTGERGDMRGDWGDTRLAREPSRGGVGPD